MMELSALIPVGYPVEDCAVPELERKPLSEIHVVDPRERDEAPVGSRS